MLRWLRIKTCVCTGTVSLAAAVAKAGTFYMGADVSLIPFMQQQGVVFTDNGVAAPADQILYDAGANLFRIRIFVDPQSTYTNQNVGAIQSQAYDIALAQQIKADDPGAQLLLDFHYSDTWADPGSQALPAAWATPAQSLPQLDNTIQGYTANTLLAFKAAGVMPGMVQVGNEINSGMDFPTGQINFTGTTQAQQASWAAAGGLIKSAIAGVRQAQGSGSKIQVAIHIANGDQGDGTPTGGEPDYFFGKLSDPNYGNVSPSLYDIMGVSYYPTTTNSLSTLQTNLSELATVYNKNIMVLETDAPWETTAAVSDPNYPDTLAGQLQFLTDLRNTVQSLPNGDGMGLLYWYPESVQVSGYTIYNGGATALFNSSHGSLSAMSAFNTTGLITATWIVNQSTNWSTASNWLGGQVPNAAGAEANLLSAISLPRTLLINGVVVLGTINFNSANAYTLSGTGGLTLQTVSGNGAINVIAGAHTISIPTNISSPTMLNVSSGASLTFTSPVTLSAGSSLLFAGNGVVKYESTITLNPSSTIVLGNAFHSTGLNLSNGSTAAVLPHGANPVILVQLDQLSFAGTTGHWQGLVDLSNNDLVVHNGNLAAISNQISQAYSNGTWNSSAGITSTAAEDDQSHLTTLGVTLNTSNGQTPLYGTGTTLGPFDGTSPAASDVLIRFCNYGDANLDGIVDGSDYSLIDNGSLQHLTGWYNGDFNYDGIINGSDYTLIDNAFNTQAANLSTQAVIASQVSSVIDTSAVPEPYAATSGVALLLNVLLARPANAKNKRLKTGSRFLR